MLHRKELTRSPIQHLIVLHKFVDGLLTRQLFDSLVFVFVLAGTSEQKNRCFVIAKTMNHCFSAYPISLQAIRLQSSPKSRPSFDRWS
jgi:hypothetical protein